MDQILTLVIEDNKWLCLSIPFRLYMVRWYIDQGFKLLEELVIQKLKETSKRSLTVGIGTMLCVQYNSLMFTHAFIATFRKLLGQQVDKMPLMQEDSDTVNKQCYATILYDIPYSTIMKNRNVDA
ncbi:hypothetical protein MAM1_0038d02755 [Mucor ambiguus]|uniref:Uncharacterized protein n=1 Tax=Mucor ambiguus TaxID=91626 RepID=A0A0C9MJI6_9FUNG|nr:hypothetical protein MAM1_0038d02755 [Mucor ambiguus]